MHSKLIPTAEMFHVFIPIVMFNTTVKNTSRQMKYHLRKNILANVHKFDFFRIYDSNRHGLF